MDGLRELKGENDVYAMFAAYNYACCLFDLGRYGDAAAIFEPLLTVRYRVLGHSHASSLYTAGRLADTLRITGHPVESQAVLDEVYSHLDEIKATTGWGRARPLWNVMSFYADFGRLDRAAELESVIYQMYLRAKTEEVQETAYPQFADDLAMLLATSPHGELRDPDRAIKLATKVCELTDYKDEAAVTVLAKVKAASSDKTNVGGDNGTHP